MENNENIEVNFRDRIAVNRINGLTLKENEESQRIICNVGCEIRCTVAGFAEDCIIIGDIEFDPEEPEYYDIPGLWSTHRKHIIRKISEFPHIEEYDIHNTNLSLYKLGLKTGGLMEDPEGEIKHIIIVRAESLDEAKDKWFRKAKSQHGLERKHWDRSNKTYWGWPIIDLTE